MSETFSEQLLKARFSEYQKTGKQGAADIVLGEIVRAQAEDTAFKGFFKPEKNLDINVEDWISSED